MKISKLFAALLGTVTFALSITASAYTVSIDEFSVTKNHAPGWFVDPFSDGAPPPSNPMNPPFTFTYSVFGTVGPEGNGRLVMDQLGAAMSVNALGQPRLVQAVTLNSNASRTIDSGNTEYGLGLKSWDSFTVVGTFDYSTPGPGVVYGIRLTDSAPDSTTARDDILDLFVYGGSSPSMLFLAQNFVAGTQTVIGGGAPVPLASITFDQISLMLTHAGGTTSVSASWDYLLGGSVVGSGAWGATGTLFSNEPYTRAAFLVSAPVPEPETYAMLLAGLSLLALAARRRKAS